MTARFFAVEDNPDDVIFLKRAFARTDCRLEIFQNVSEVLSVITASESTLPDALLVDLKLPGQTSLDLISVIKKSDKFCFVPIVVLSASTFELDIAEAYKAGASSYVVKPIDYSAFETLVKQIVQYWGGINTRVNGAACDGHPLA